MTQNICRPLSKFAPLLSISEFLFLYLILNIIRFIGSHTCIHCCIQNLSDRSACYVCCSHWCIYTLSVISIWISSWYLRCMIRFSYSAICSISLLYEVFAVIKKWVLKLYLRFIAGENIWISGFITFNFANSCPAVKFIWLGWFWIHHVIEVSPSL